MDIHPQSTQCLGKFKIKEEHNVLFEVKSEIHDFSEDDIYYDHNTLPMNTEYDSQSNYIEADIPGDYFEEKKEAFNEKPSVEYGKNDLLSAQIFQLSQISNFNCKVCEMIGNKSLDSGTLKSYLIRGAKKECGKCGKTFSGHYAATYFQNHIKKCFRQKKKKHKCDRCQQGNIEFMPNFIKPNSQPEL